MSAAAGAKRVRGADILGAVTPKLFKAGDVCDATGVQPYVLRSWEAEFPQIGQPSSGGARLYRRSDIELVLRIKQLVFEEGLTLSGARRRLDEEGDKTTASPIHIDQLLGANVRDRLKHVRSGLQSILELLSKGGEDQPELRLVAPTPPKKKTVAKAKAKK